jgi:Holliday junction resolvasome RuvABC ATP-dependent DNA helicase subunit
MRRQANYEARILDGLILAKQHLLIILRAMQDMQHFNASVRDAKENQIVAVDAAAYALIFVTRQQGKCPGPLSERFAALIAFIDECSRARRGCPA